MKVLFAGPSLSERFSEISARTDAFMCAGPVAQGDVARAVHCGAVAIGIVDGRFEDTLSVWHKEILYALSMGVFVAGAASMGALRAVECAAFGMVGIGEVYRCYASGQSTDDADVGQLHAPAELNYVPLTEPLVNIEPTLTKMKDIDLIAAQEFESLMTTAKSLHYKERTYRGLFGSTPGIDSLRAEGLTEWAAANAINQKLLDSLELVDWLEAQPMKRGSRPDWEFSSTSHWQALAQSLGVIPTVRAA